MGDRLIGDNATGAFSVVMCHACREVKTHHRCLAPLETGGVFCGVLGRVCGMAICGPCNFKFGNEGVTRCHRHSRENEVEPNPDLTVEDDKENKDGRKKSKVVAKAPKAAEYSAKDLLILSQAFIRTSKNAIEGTSQKKNSSGMMLQLLTMS